MTVTMTVTMTVMATVAVDLSLNIPRRRHPLRSRLVAPLAGHIRRGPQGLLPGSLTHSLTAAEPETSEPDQTAIGTM